MTQVIDHPPVLGMDTASNRVHTVGPRLSVNDPNPRRIEQFAVKSSDKNPDVRRQVLYNGVHNYFGDLEESVFGAFHIFCEEPLALRNGKTTRILGLAAGAVWAAHLDFDCYWHWVDVASWKKHVVGNGNATKDQIQEHLAAMGFQFDEEDWWDACGLREYGVLKLKELLQQS